MNTEKKGAALRQTAYEQYSRAMRSRHLEYMPDRSKWVFFCTYDAYKTLRATDELRFVRPDQPLTLFGEIEVRATVDVDASAPDIMLFVPAPDA